MVDQVGVHDLLDALDQGFLVEEEDLVLGRVDVDVEVLGRKLEAEVDERMGVLGQVGRVDLFQPFPDCWKARCKSGDRFCSSCM